jgi:hypothetical protein
LLVNVRGIGISKNKSPELLSGMSDAFFGCSLFYPGVQKVSSNISHMRMFLLINRRLIPSFGNSFQFARSSKSGWEEEVIITRVLTRNSSFPQMELWWVPNGSALLLFVLQKATVCCLFGRILWGFNNSFGLIRQGGRDYVHTHVRQSDE